MSNMKNEFTTFEQALTLKELGYREECAAHYPFDEELHLKWRYYGNMSTHPLNTLQAPTKSQIFRWFREKYDIHHNINLEYNQLDSTRGYNWTLSNFTGVFDEYIFSEGLNRPSGYWMFKTYEEAENACIDKLIEIAKQDNGK